jgi:hypothetical protein
VKVARSEVAAIDDPTAYNEASWLIIGAFCALEGPSKSVGSWPPPCRYSHNNDFISYCRVYDNVKTLSR